MPSRTTAINLFVSAVILAALLTPIAGAQPSPSSFSFAEPKRLLTFPADHGMHPSFETEWWYYTGQLYEEGRTPFRDPPRYGFQLTFFRRSRDVSGALAQSYLAHAVVTDIAAQRSYADSRAADGQLGIAGAASDWLRVWNGDWSAELAGNRHLLRGSVARGGAERLTFALLGDDGVPMLQGENGFSSKGNCEHCASHYYSIPGMRLTGTVFGDGGARPVSGIGWMDHEFMTNALGADQQGWDWSALSFAGGDRLMVFRVRKKDGTTDFASGGLLRKGTYHRLIAGQMKMTPSDTWRSPLTGAEYPITWRIEVPEYGIDTTVAARVSDCEIGASTTGAPVYWEGPVASKDESVIGYLEMTGYHGKTDL